VSQKKKKIAEKVSPRPFFGVLVMLLVIINLLFLDYY